MPRPPQGRPVTVIDATGDGDGGPAARRRRPRTPTSRCVRAEDPQAAGAARTALRDRARALGRNPDRLIVLGLAARRAVLLGGRSSALADLLGDWHADGAADGFHLRPADPARDLAHLVDGTVPVLQHRCLFRRFYPGATLREHLGLPRPANRYALAREAS